MLRNQISGLRRGLPGLAIVLVASCDAVPGPGSGEPAEIVLVGGDDQSAVVGQVLREDLTLRVLNHHGQTVAGVVVEFVVTAGGGSLEPPEARSDGRGIARAAWTLGPVAGEQAVEARVYGRGVAPIIFRATALASDPAELARVSARELSGTVGQPLADPLVVRILDAYGNGVAGVAVTWSTEHGSFSAASTESDGEGFARSVWTLGTGSGDQRAIARTPIDSVDFTAEAAPGAVSRVHITPDTLGVLHRAIVQVEASAFDIYDNRVAPAGGFEWSSTDAGVAVAEAQVGASERASIATRGVGGTLVRAAAGEIGGTLHVTVIAEVTGPFLTHRVGSEPSAINDRGELVALVYSGVGRAGSIALWAGEWAQRWSGEIFGGDWIAAVNNSQTILYNQFIPTHTGIRQGGIAWWLRDGSLTRLPMNTAVDVTEADAVVGVQRHPPAGAPPDGFHTIRRGVLWVDGQLLSLSTPDGSGDWQTAPTAINARGQVALNMTPDGLGDPLNAWASTAYLWHEGRYTLIPRPHPSCLGWIAQALNDHGAAVLACGTEDGGRSLFLWNGATAVPLYPLTQVSRGGLNDRGEVVGTGADGVYYWRAGEAVRLLAIDPGSLHQAGPQINNSGHIVFTPKTWGGVLLTPLPGHGERLSRPRAAPRE
jgi:hypothetical protein